MNFSDEIKKIVVQKMNHLLNNHDIPVNITDNENDIDLEYGVDKEFLNTEVLYETYDKPIERKTFRELIGVFKRNDRVHYKSDHNGLFDCDKIDNFLKKNSKHYISTMFGSREFKNHTVIVIG